ncbi:uncharacterized protein LOC125025125 [Penaeus chinensis]|uniref:uncharacterized protein LOC125025125 n=1 Tax=Penaeus chinensis TaxID=139456 RepID=UPI001FB66C77|nr:uncharacterized protein LOC125025125 [Penaeus chinensis]
MKLKAIMQDFRILFPVWLSALVLLAFGLDLLPSLDLRGQSESRDTGFNTRDGERSDESPLFCPMPALRTGEQFRNALTKIEIPCANMKTFGGPPRGKKGSSKNVCLDARFGVVPGKCVVFSFGINHDWSFEDEMAEFGCKVFAYDPTMDVESHQRSPNVQFFATGISNYNGRK